MTTAQKPRKPSRVTADDARIDIALVHLFTAASELGGKLRSLNARLADPRYQGHPKRSKAVAHADKLAGEILRLANDAASSWHRYTLKRKRELIAYGFAWPPPVASRAEAVRFFQNDWTELYGIVEDKAT